MAAAKKIKAETTILRVRFLDMPTKPLMPFNPHEGGAEPPARLFYAFCQGRCNKTLEFDACLSVYSITPLFWQECYPPKERHSMGVHQSPNER